MNIVFLGTPDFAVPTLQALIDSEHKVVAVVCQPDKPVGRHQTITTGPVKELALKHGIKVLQYNKIRLEGVNELKSFNADVFVTCAYGQILSQEILDIPKFGVFNVHGSLLPKYRGAAPIQWAVINGDKTSGITILKTEIGMDDGPMVLKREVEIKQYETAGELFFKLAPIGAQCLIEALKLIENGEATFTPQNSTEVTTCKMLKKENFNLNFNNSVNSIINLIHGLNPWPVAEVSINGSKFKFYRAMLQNEGALINYGIKELKEYKNGEVVVANPKIGLVIKASNGFINITELQTENGKIMPSKSYLNGKQINAGTVVNE